jgi:hypothetical protein
MWRPGRVPFPIEFRLYMRLSGARNRDPRPFPCRYRQTGDQLWPLNGSLLHPYLCHVNILRIGVPPLTRLMPINLNHSAPHPPLIDIYLRHNVPLPPFLSLPLTHIISTLDSKRDDLYLVSDIMKTCTTAHGRHTIGVNDLLAHT